jgi:hypothetical protein
MDMEEQNQSEVRRLLETIDREYQAAQFGLSGLAQGTSQHEFINARMEKIEDIREKLVDLVGEEQAGRLVVQQMERSKDAHGKE